MSQLYHFAASLMAASVGRDYTPLRAEPPLDPPDEIDWSELRDNYLSRNGWDPVIRKLGGYPDDVLNYLWEGQPEKARAALIRAVDQLIQESADSSAADHAIALHEARQWTR